MLIGKVRASNPAGSGALRVALGFGLVVLAGTGLLLLPAAAAEGERATLLEALFTTVSAICVTGLVVVDTQAHWSLLGEAVIAIVIHVGGLGYMAGLGILLWMLGRNLGLRDRNLMRLYYGSPSMGEAINFVKTMILYTALFEVAGMIALFAGFTLAGVPASRSVWWSIFHAISAFNVAGFNVSGEDIVPYADDPLVLIPIATLSIAGSVGTVPVIIALRQFNLSHASLDAKLILSGVAAVLLAGALFIAAVEWNNAGTLASVHPGHRPLLAFFQSAMWTSGLSAVDSGLFRDETKFFESVMMLIGGGAGSPSGGIKVATAAILIYAAVASIRGRPGVVIFGRQVPQSAIRQAGTMTFAFIAFFLVAVVALLAASEELALIDVMYEASSALGTVGWSAGITAEFGTAGKLILILTMLVGRFLPLMLVLQMTRPRRTFETHWPEDGIRQG